MFRLLLLIFISIYVLSIIGCSTQKLYDMAINYERGLADLEIKSVKLDFGEIIYLDNNIKSHTAFVLLHGFGGDKDNWNRFSAELNKSRRIIIPDLPGHGESVSTHELDYSTTHQSQMLSVFLEAIDIEKIHIVGNSMGGAIAIRYSSTHANKVQSLSLIDSLGMTTTKSEFDLIIAASGSNPMLDVCTEQAFESLLKLGMHKPPYVPGIFMDDLVAKKCARSGIEKIVYDEMMEDSDLSDIVKSITVPTIIIWGKRDRVIHVDNSQLFHRSINGSKLVILGDLGHVPLLEDPIKTAKLIEEFVK